VEEGSRQQSDLEIPPWKEDEPMKTEEPITLRRDCKAVMIPSGEAVTLSSGTSVWLTQSLGGSYTVMTDRGYMVRIEAEDAEAVGLPRGTDEGSERTRSEGGDDVEMQVWSQLKRCFDPEIPVNIVDLGLIYRCEAIPLATGGYRIEVRFTLTAQGCGMGQTLKRDIEGRLLTVPGVCEVDVELVWDPPWNQSMISESAKQQLGIE